MAETVTKKNNRSLLAKVKLVGVIFGCLGFMVVSITVAWYARQYQILNKPMPNGKGGYMSFRDGYYIALICFLMSVAWAIAARKLLASTRKTDSSSYKPLHKQ
jgi:hypothetical protein